MSRACTVLGSLGAARSGIGMVGPAVRLVPGRVQLKPRRGGANHHAALTAFVQAAAQANDAMVIWRY